MTEPAAEPTLFHANAFERTAEGPRLVGTRCRACGACFHPRVSICFECLGDDLEAVRLGPSGTLECFTTVHMPAERIVAPYTVGYVKLSEGLRVFAPIEAPAGSLAVGMAMRLADFRLGRGGTEALAYCFVAEPGRQTP